MIVVNIIYGYVFLGFCFALYFVFFGGANKLHHNIQKGGLGLKLLLMPASVILWPYLLNKTILKK